MIQKDQSEFSVGLLVTGVCDDSMGTLTHVWLAAVSSASITAHFGWLHRLPQGDGVGLVLFIHILTIIVLWLAVLDKT